MQIQIITTNFCVDSEHKGSTCLWRNLWEEPLVVFVCSRGFEKRWPPPWSHKYSLRPKVFYWSNSQPEYWLGYCFASTPSLSLIFLWPAPFWEFDYISNLKGLSSTCGSTGHRSVPKMWRVRKFEQLDWRMEKREAACWSVRQVPMWTFSSWAMAEANKLGSTKVRLFPEMWSLFKLLLPCTILSKIASIWRTVRSLCDMWASSRPVTALATKSGSSFSKLVPSMLSSFNFESPAIAIKIDSDCADVSGFWYMNTSSRCAIRPASRDGWKCEILQTGLWKITVRIPSHLVSSRSSSSVTAKILISLTIQIHLELRILGMESRFVESMRKETQDQRQGDNPTSLHLRHTRTATLIVGMFNRPSDQQMMIFWKF